MAISAACNPGSKCTGSQAWTGCTTRTCGHVASQKQVVAQWQQQQMLHLQQALQSQHLMQQRQDDNAEDAEIICT